MVSQAGVTSGAEATDDRYRVLLPIDADERSARAQVRYVGALPLASESVLVTLTHVYHSRELDDAGGPLGGDHVAVLRETARRLTDLGVASEIRDVAYAGRVDRAILGLADRVDADVIVLSGRKRGALESALFTGVAQRILRGTDRTVAVVDQNGPRVAPAPAPGPVCATCGTPTGPDDVVVYNSAEDPLQVSECAGCGATVEVTSHRW